MLCARCLLMSILDSETVAEVADPGRTYSGSSTARPRSTPAAAGARSCVVETDFLIAAAMRSTSGNAAYS